LTYVGAAIKEGQDLNGVEQAPRILRESGLFKSLQEKFSVNVVDDGDVSFSDLKG
jgi:hypothetical protein